MSQYIQKVKTNHTWFTGVSIKTTDMTIYILCVYLPCDSMHNEDKFLNCLGILDSYIKSLPSVHIIVTGDFNTDHHRNSSFSVFLDSFIVENRLCFLDKEMLPTGSFTYLSTAWNTTSWIDHCICSLTTKPLIIELNILYSYVSSDHKPLQFKIQVDI